MKKNLAKELKKDIPKYIKKEMFFFLYTYETNNKYLMHYNHYHDKLGRFASKNFGPQKAKAIKKRTAKGAAAGAALGGAAGAGLTSKIISDSAKDWTREVARLNAFLVKRAWNHKQFVENSSNPDFFLKAGRLAADPGSIVSLTKLHPNLVEAIREAPYKVMSGALVGAIPGAIAGIVVNNLVGLAIDHIRNMDNNEYEEVIRDGKKFIEKQFDKTKTKRR